MRFTKSVPLVALLSVSAAAGGVSISPNVSAGDRCRHVRAHVHTTLVSAGCQSPVGICTTGTVDGGPFEGATTFLTLNAAPSAGMPGTEPAANLSYSGTFTVTQRSGTFVASDLGVLDPGHAAFTEMTRSVSGTGRFENPTGTLFISGQIVDNSTAFDGFITGELCTDRGDD
jgi:hypothetical protein